MRLIDLDELMKFPLRIDNYDKENGNEVFMLGIESVLDYAEELPTVDAIPIEYINRRIETLNEYISKLGGSFDHEEMVNAYIHEVSALVRLIVDRMKED